MSKKDKQLQVKAPEVTRNEKGQIVSGTANPGGQPKWVKEEVNDCYQWRANG